ncbi:MAG: DoxX family membrane protein [bacterium]|nr:DoxX family membrane protein [bacterium]
MNSKKIPEFFLRFGLALVFLYAGVFGFLNPMDWIGFLPSWVKDMAPASLSDQNVLAVFSATEILMGLLLLFGIQVFLVSIVSSCMLLGIVVFNWGAMDIIFRDIGLFFAALALMFLARQRP